MSSRLERATTLVKAFLRGAQVAMTRQDPAAAPVLSALALGADITERVVILVAHQDDETLGLGARLASFKAATLIHVTTGAADAQRAAREGFADAETHAAVRRRELEQSLTILGGGQLERIDFGYADGALIEDLPGFTARVIDALTEAVVVITHSYEGGHPDHDACAFAAQVAARRRAREGRPLLRLEFAGYHQQDGAQRTGVFWPDDQVSEARVRLSGPQALRKLRAMAAFRSQSWIRWTFPFDHEAYRVAPAYDFSTPPPPGAWLYDQLDWEIKGKNWLLSAQNALNQLDVTATPVI